MSDLISVVVPVYNVHKYLKKCVYSIINQSYTNLEIILVDDGSTDGSGKLCDEISKIDDRIVVIHKTNGGLSDARNVGIENARGDFIGFVDSDDYVDPKMYSLLLDSCKNNKAMIAMCGRYVVDEEKRQLNKCFSLDNEVIYSSKEALDHFLRYDTCDASACDKLYDTSLFKKIRYPLGVMAEDYQVTPRLFAQSNKIVHVGKALYYYVQRDGSITKQAFTVRRINVLKQVDLMIDFILSVYPDLNIQTDFFRGKHLISLQRFALQSTDEAMIKYMCNVNNVCKKNRKIIINNRLFSMDQKIKFVIRLLLLEKHIKYLKRKELDGI